MCASPFAALRFLRPVHICTFIFPSRAAPLIARVFRLFCARPGLHSHSECVYALIFVMIFSTDFGLPDDFAVVVVVVVVILSAESADSYQTHNADQM